MKILDKSGEIIFEIDKESLVGADLKGVNLKNASLEGANLEGVNLEGADLVNAELNHNIPLGSGRSFLFLFATLQFAV